MSLEQLRKRGSGLIADMGRNPRNPLVAGFEQDAASDIRRAIR
jgi:hypothetical protein